MTSKYIRRAHNVSVLLYHYVCVVKYREGIFDDKVEEVLIRTCEEISERYDINFLEIGTDQNHAHFLIQSVPTMSPEQIARTIKSITAKEIFRLCPWVKLKLWGGNVWSEGYFVSTVSRTGCEGQVKNYVRSQKMEYHQLKRGQLVLFDEHKH